MEEATVSFNFEARYFKLRKLSANTRQIWFVCHGYGQRAEFFIRKFKILDNEQHFIIAPEGLSRFYLQGFSGRVGATWMTKEKRLLDVQNYLQYLNKIYTTEVPESLPETVKINVLGFSQGSATVCRWALQNEIKFDKLILWTGMFPEDLDIEFARQKLHNRQVVLVTGTKDPFINSRQEALQQRMTNQLYIQPHIFTFNGGHEIDANTLLQVAEGNGMPLP